MAADTGRDWRGIVRSVRFRITALATLIFVVVLVATGVALVLLQGRALTGAIDSALRQRADDLEAVLTSGELPAELGTGADETLVQLVGEDGAVLVASSNVAAAALDVALPARGELIATVLLPNVDDDPFRLLTRRVSANGNGAVVLHVGGSLDDVRDSVSALWRSLALAIPVVAVVLAILGWGLVGRSLRPVESIRTEVARISGAALDRRVPVPATGDEIERLAITMNRMLDRIEEASLRQQRFTADASHELRNPLTRMRSELEVDAAHPESADLAATQQSVLEEIGHLERLIDDLLHLARSDAAAAGRNVVEIELGDLVRHEVELAKPPQPVAMAVAADEPVYVRGDRRTLGRAVANLLDNAVRHAADRVEVTVSRNGEHAVVTVADDGPGVPSDARELIFERFARLDPARGAVTGGTGLGLAIVRDIAERHGGTVRVADGRTGGACFVMELPAVGG